MNNSLPVYAIVWSLVVLFPPTCFLYANEGKTSRNERPNIIIILADDMGFSDLGCTGSEIETPNLDHLARQGLLFTNFYNTSRCCPSRAALLTGQYQWDAGMGHMTYTKSKYPEYQQVMNMNNATIAELLRQTGYQTVTTGKWHLGNNRDYWPDKRGFDNFYGTPTGGGIYFYPSKFYDRSVYSDGKRIEPGEAWFSTDGFTDYAIDFITKKRNKERPFFMYVAYIAPHFPLQAKAKDIQKYHGKYDVGYQFIRNARFNKQVGQDIFDSKRTPSKPTFKDWESIKSKPTESRKMAVYAAQVDNMDQNIGRILQALEDTDSLDNTVLMFLSDNGGCSAGWNKTPEAEIGTRECNAAYGAWYNVSNTPYRQSKSRVHEGGIITPLIVHWPNGISEPGKMVKRPAHIMDIMPTCLELAGTTYPNTFESRSIDPIDGQSILPWVTSKKTEEHSKKRLLFWEHEGNRSVRKGDWKLVALRKKKWELYDLSQDPFETNNLAAEHPAIVSELSEAFKKWAAEHGVRPWPLKKKQR